MHFLYSEERNELQKGYGSPFDVYMYRDDESVIVSYGKKAEPFINDFKEKVAAVFNADALMKAAYYTFGATPCHNIKYIYAKTRMPSTAIVLERTDYLKFRDFFEECHNTVAGEWLYDWYIDMVEQKLCCGYFADGVLASCTDAPDMPYMSESVQEIGINTLERYSGKGYATECCKKCIENIIANSKCPIWSTSAGNFASQALAEKVGFVKLADVITLIL